MSLAAFNVAQFYTKGWFDFSSRQTEACFSPTLTARMLYSGFIVLDYHLTVLINWS